jgi:hypothetical protein
VWFRGWGGWRLKLNPEVLGLLLERVEKGEDRVVTWWWECFLADTIVIMVCVEMLVILWFGWLASEFDRVDAREIGWDGSDRLE